MSGKAKNLTLACLGILSLLFTSSCSTGKSQSCGAADKDWATNLSLWKSNGILDYDMIVERYQDPMYGHVPFLFKVRNGKNISMEPARTNSGLERTDGYEAVATVEQMFDTMEEACERGDNVNVTYDSKLGVPNYFGFSNIKDPPDSGMGFKLEKFLPVGK